MPTYPLTDLSRDFWVDAFSMSSAKLGFAGPAWSVSKRTLRGGRRDGVDLIEVESGDLAFSVAPTRGMGIWRASFAGDRVGWNSPVKDGPVNPAFVNLVGRGGLGWLEGFDELLARCGLSHNGAPYREGDVLHTLHGKIANRPAHFVALHVDDHAPHTITLEGRVDEAELFFTQMRMTTRISTVPGSNRVTVRDAFTNQSDSPGAMQILYHWNLGPPHMEEGARFVAPFEIVCPRDARAAEGIDHFNVYGPPAPSSSEQVYFLKLIGDGPDDRTLALLRNRAGDKGVALRFSTRELPCFTLWKSSQGLREGHVTGLEPATNFPNPYPFEAARGRVVSLAPGATHVAETTFEILNGAREIAALEAEVARLQTRAEPKMHAKPIEPFAPET
jgi:Domain of unknown function (DUF4432)